MRGEAKDCNSPCGPGVQVCKNGQFTACSSTAVGEICDGKDNDCNGVVDDGCQKCNPGETQKCGSDQGICKQGDQACKPDGTWSECSGGIAPEAKEACDGKDNNCNGAVDEGCGCTPGLQEPCGLEAGECKPGFKVCNPQGQWGECIGATPPKDEVCNGIDDDCDGIVDDGLGCECIAGETQPCGSNSTGACKTGLQVCGPEGKWGPCQGAVAPKPEVCNDGIDNNCDGKVDEGCVCFGAGVGPWQIYKDKQEHCFGQKLDDADPAIFDVVNGAIPGPSGGWSPWGKPLIDFNDPSNFEDLCDGGHTGGEFTYFQTFIDVPDGFAVTKVQASWGVFDDAVQVRVAPPGGQLTTKSTWNKSPVDLTASFSKPGKYRVVVIHVDTNCCERSLSQFKLTLNGKQIGACK